MELNSKLNTLQSTKSVVYIFGHYIIIIIKKSLHTSLDNEELLKSIEFIYKAGKLYMMLNKLHETQ